MDLFTLTKEPPRVACDPGEQDLGDYDPFDDGRSDRLRAEIEQRTAQKASAKESGELTDEEEIASEKWRNRKEPKGKTPKPTNEGDGAYRAVLRYLGLSSNTGFWEKVECLQVAGGWSGGHQHGGGYMATMKKDFAGFGDYSLTVPPYGQHIAVQVTSEGQKGAHYRKFINDTTGGGKVPILRRLQQFLASGGRVLMVTYSGKPGKWDWKVEDVTTEELEKYIARRRKT